jgi:hypothetical protein
MLKLFHPRVILIVKVPIVTSPLITFFISQISTTLNSKLNKIKLVVHLKESLLWNFCDDLTSNFDPNHDEEVGEQGVPIISSIFPKE